MILTDEQRATYELLRAKFPPAMEFDWLGFRVRVVGHYWTNGYDLSAPMVRFQYRDIDGIIRDGQIPAEAAMNLSKELE